METGQCFYENLNELYSESTQGITYAQNIGSALDSCHGSLELINSRSSACALLSVD